MSVRHDSLPVRRLLPIPHRFARLARPDSPDGQLDGLGRYDVHDLTGRGGEPDHGEDPGPKVFEQERDGLTELCHRQGTEACDIYVPLGTVL